MTTKNLLTNAREEILQLRRQNEILSAKVEMVDLFACVLHTKPAEHSQGMAEDVAWRLQQAIDCLEDAEKDNTE